MNCFYHPTTVAVGLCKSCSKGICTECAVDMGKGLACKGRCEQDVTNVISLIDQGVNQRPMQAKLMGRARANSLILAGMPISLGLVFLGGGIYDFITEGFGFLSLFLLPLGLIFLGYGCFTIIRALTLPKITSPEGK